MLVLDISFFISIYIIFKSFLNYIIFAKIKKGDDALKVDRLAHFFITQGARICDEDDLNAIINDTKVELTNEYDPRRLQAYRTLSYLESLNPSADVLTQDLYSILSAWDPFADTSGV